MKVSTISELKEELINAPTDKLLQLCIRLAKYKKENKELLSYLLFEAHDDEGYIKKIQTDIKEQFDELNKKNLYFVKKGLRKILRQTNKYIKYTGSVMVEAELLIYFCSLLKASDIQIYRNQALTNLYEQQLKKIQKAISSMHEDLQYDYLKTAENLYKSR